MPYPLMLQRDRMRKRDLLARTKSHMWRAIVNGSAFTTGGFMPSVKAVACTKCLHYCDAVALQTETLF